MTSFFVLFPTVILHTTCAFWTGVVCFRLLKGHLTKNVQYTWMLVQKTSCARQLCVVCWRRLRIVASQGQTLFPDLKVQESGNLFQKQFALTQSFDMEKDLQHPNQHPLSRAKRKTTESTSSSHRWATVTLNAQEPETEYVKYQYGFQMYCHKKFKQKNQGYEPMAFLHSVVTQNKRIWWRWT